MSNSSDDSDSFDDTSSDSSSDDEYEKLSIPKRLKTKKESDVFKYTILTPADLVSSQVKAITAINDIVQIPYSSCRLLLLHYNWKEFKLLEDYYSEPDKVFRDAGVVNPKNTPTNKELTKDDTVVECEICFLPSNEGSMSALGCNHYFCNECWISYLKSKILDEASISIECPDSSCDLCVDEKTVSDLLADEHDVKSKYQYLAAKQFVQGNAKIRWCTGVDCQNASEVVEIEPQTVTCSCGHMYCFGCGENPHQPLTCDLYSRWLTKCRDDSETANWLNVNTRPCPNCKATVQKNGGCNHMTCQACKYSYCWICQGAWGPHGQSWYNCNRWEDRPSNSNIDESRRLLEKYLFYFTRYENHENSLKKEEPLKKKVGKLMEEMQKRNMPWIQVQCMAKAVEILRLCRTTLKHTYAFAFYLAKGDNQATIFEDNQKDLEMCTEALSHILEEQDYFDLPLNVTADCNSNDNKSDEKDKNETSKQGKVDKANIDKVVYVDQDRDEGLEGAVEVDTGNGSNNSIKSVAPRSLNELREIVVNRSALCNSRCDVLMDHVNEGYEQNYWVFEDKHWSAN